MGIDLRRAHAGVPQDLLDDSEVGAALEHVGGAAVAERVGMDGAGGQPRGVGVALDHPLDRAAAEPPSLGVQPQRAATG